MAEPFLSRLKHAFNVITGSERQSYKYYDLGPSYTYRPDRIDMSINNKRSIVNAVINRIAMDVASASIRHVKLDANRRYLEDMDSGLNRCLTVEANIDQTARAFIQDIAMSTLDEGVIAVVPIDTTLDPNLTNGYDIITMRTGKILEWYPEHIKVRLYNDRTGRKEEIVVPKKIVAIIENPMYAVMNEANSTLKRLVRKMNLLDVIDEQSGAGKLDLIIQLPYVIKTEARRRQAENRRKDIENQLAGSKYGIAYTDGTERITQLNRSVDNNLMHQIEYLTSMLYSQLGLTEEILNGTADENVMTNYQTRTIEPIISAIVDEMGRKFLSKTAVARGQAIMFFSDPFKLVPLSKVAEIADKFTRNEIMSTNEFRQQIGMKPVNDPKADELRNKNLNPSEGQTYANANSDPDAEQINSVT